ncbi:very short patch repair endonuclease [Dokdonella sp. MW10]|uniref:very short patch repair endonuclease n=1 Tax=Dokdonella sp. MW10 TaxID=2992926 RepID=UPI003F808186
MSGIRDRDTKPEWLVRRALHARGFRYRLHARELPGRPDIVLPRHRAVVFVHGCFWHGHDCRYFRLPSTRPEFWANKIARNQSNDTRASALLSEAGWRVAIVWECAVRDRRRDIDAVADALAQWLHGESAIWEIRG